MTSIRVMSNLLYVDDNVLSFPHKILDAFECDGVVIVFMDPDENLGEPEQFKNVVGISLSGERLWEAELPTTKKSDVYWRIASRCPLVASSFSSYDCQINPATGRIVRSDFYK